MIRYDPRYPIKTWQIVYSTSGFYPSYIGNVMIGDSISFYNKSKIRMKIDFYRGGNIRQLHTVMQGRSVKIKINQATSYFYIETHTHDRGSFIVGGRPMLPPG